MTNSEPSDIADLLSRSVGHLNAGETDKAETLLHDLVAMRRDVPQALMLMGTVRLKQQRYPEAEALLSKALAATPGQPMVLLYLGHALREQSKLASAIDAYRAAIKGRRAFVEAELALAGTLRAFDKSDEAETVYRTLLRRDAACIPALAGLAAALNDQERYIEAEGLVSARSLQTVDVATRAELENSLGFSKMRQRRFAEALPHFERALTEQPGMPAAERNRAMVLEYLNQPTRAAAAYQRILARDPLDQKTHLLLNELLHRTGRQTEMLQSYDRASRAQPLSPVPLTAKADQLMLLNRPAEAAEYYRSAIRLAPDHAAAHIGLGRAWTALSEPARAIAAFETGLSTCPDCSDLDTAFAYCLLGQGDAVRARALAEAAVHKGPDSQSALAVLGLCYRARNDAREGGLNDYERFVGVFDLENPEGDDFHHALAAHLDGIHEGAKEFFSQTLRGGTRAPEEIFGYRNSLRDALKLRINKAMDRFIAGLPEDRNHPFLKRRARGFTFSGSWSSRMRDGGYHVNHIHSGWISSVYYVEVPEVTKGGSAKQGWLKFGEPPADLGSQDQARRFVQPRPGRLVLFPSYMWHGTVPFQSDQTRTTIAFDAVPR